MSPSIDQSAPRRLSKIPIILSMCLIGAALTIEPGRMLGALYRNLGSLFTTKVAYQASQMTPAETRDWYEQVAKQSLAQEAAEFFKLAYTLDPNPSAQRAGARLAFWMGDYDPAANLFHRLVDGSEPTFIIEYALVSFSQRSEFNSVIELYETNPFPTRSNITRESIILPYLDRATSLLNAGDIEQAKVGFEAARALRPGDLYANLQLYKFAWQGNQSGLRYRQVLDLPSKESTTVMDDRLLTYTINAARNLISEGMWNEEKALFFSGNLVWRYYEDTKLKEFIEDLQTRWPDHLEIKFLLGELFERRGSLIQAENTYVDILKRNPDYIEAMFRLGAVMEAHGRLGEVAQWYARYHEVRPDDLIATKSLARIYAALGNADASKVRRELEDATNPVRTVSSALNVSASDVKLGFELLLDSGFEEAYRQASEARLPKNLDEGATGQRVKGWTISNPDWGVDGLDSLEAFSGRYSARIDGFWTKESPYSLLLAFVARSASSSDPYYLPVKPGRIISITGAYKTMGNSGPLKIRLGTKDSVQLINDLALPGTNGAWHYFTFLGCSNGDDLAKMALVLRIWNTGRVWFDDISVRDVTVPLSNSLCSSLQTNPILSVNSH